MADRGFFNLSQPVQAGSIFHAFGAPSMQEYKIQQEREAKLQAAKLSAMQLALKTYPVGDPRRDPIEASLMQHFGGGQDAANAIAAIRPDAAPTPASIIQAGDEGVPENFVAIRGPEGGLKLQRTDTAAPKKSFQSLTAIHRGSGATMRARFDPTAGHTTDEFGNRLGPEWITTKTNISAPTPGAITRTQQGKSEAGLRQRRVATTQALNTSDRMINLVEKNPAAFTTGANLAGLADTIGTATKSMLFALGVETNLSQADPLDYPDEFWGPLINASDEGKQLAFVLALQLAAATGLGEGRALTDKDVQRAVQLVGTDVQSPERVKARLKSNQRTLMEHHNIDRNIILGPGNDLFQDRLKEFGDSNPTAKMTDQQLLEAMNREMQAAMSGQQNAQ